jgi:hypothetical protein
MQFLLFNFAVFGPLLLCGALFLMLRESDEISLSELLWAVFLCFCPVVNILFLIGFLKELLLEFADVTVIRRPKEPSHESS